MYFKSLKELNRCRILITNDDGIEAHGIKLLEQILLKITPDVWVVAPKFERSGASHAITSDKLRSMQGHSSADAFPHDIIKISDKHYAIDGTPADCIRIALNMLMPRQVPDLIISGINNGRNIADDITYSGTVGAAVEGILYGIPSIAVSQQVDGAKIVNWQMAEKYLPGLLAKIRTGTFSADTLININFPNIPFGRLRGIAVCRHGSRRFVEGTHEHERLNLAALMEEPIVEAERYQDDNIAIKDHITVSALSINLSDYAGLAELDKVLGGKFLADE